MTSNDLSATFIYQGMGSRPIFASLVNLQALLVNNGIAA